MISYNNKLRLIAIIVGGDDYRNLPKLWCGPDLVEFVQPVFPIIIDFIKKHTGNYICIPKPDQRN